MSLDRKFLEAQMLYEKKIADLEAKLAESEKLIFTYQNIFKQKPETALEMCEFVKPYERKLGKQELEIKQLKQQLDEKEKEVEELRFKERNIFPLVENLEEKINQDKISFALEQLEKVKAELVNNVSPVNLSYTEYVQEVFDKLNNQIKQLKEMSDE